ncbi:Os1348 family NHLP clan protein [Pyxidicoccus sp. MSG2]|uniref:Os1348 family NHLP clan protein n=1 Tax=Pyxidicoccus sp. MSG2 TaxID=2996790 RepID=UPI0022721A3E|nr:Os1348 family NHLP clan protein [Pyxidicoccus sp. MSG2]MCY1021345.1 Os1348 family NHLP clan protein [Pyxidicoccus sp. MSG2]
MEKKLIDEITTRAISDAEFRKQLSADPERALREAGYPIEGQEAFLKSVKAALGQSPEALASEYEAGFPGGGTGGGGPMG